MIPIYLEAVKEKFPDKITIRGMRPGDIGLTIPEDPRESDVVIRLRNNKFIRLVQIGGPKANEADDGPPKVRVLPKGSTITLRVGDAVD